MILRPAEPTDCAALAAIDARSNPSPWQENQFLSALSGAHEHIWVAEAENTILGFAVWQHICGESELHLIAVDPQHRRCGIAAALMEQWFLEPAERRLLEVRQSNEAAQALYRRFGFSESGRRKHYYACPDGSREDAVLMEQSC